MENFEFKNACEIVFGKNDEKIIAQKLKQYGATNVLVHFGKNSVIKSGLLGRITDALKAEKIKFTPYGGVSANPLKSHADEGIKIAKQNKVDFILAVGGGSVIDAAKYIAIGAVDDNVWKYFQKDGIATKALPVAAVLTIPAAGSECSTASVIKDDVTGTKYSIGSECIRPVLAFINPELCFTLPIPQIGYGASDIFAHMLERYMCPQDNVVATDRMLEGTMRAMLEIAPKVYANNTSYAYWAEFCFLGMIAHNDMLCMGREIQDWGTHQMENKLLSGVYDMAHGAGLAIIFLAWLKHVSKTKPKKILEFAKNVMGADSIDQGIQNLEAWYKSIGLPVRLSQLEINAEEVKANAKKIFGEKAKVGGYGKLSLGDIYQIIDLAR